ncbi:MAG: hypothetical protein NUV77_26480, partial [Thermoguttaceae bacterium]|nr:hypothetical protein [Thermoguttaceae bacterium]
GNSLTRSDGLVNLIGGQDTARELVGRSEIGQLRIKELPGLGRIVQPSANEQFRDHRGDTSRLL